MSYLFKSMDFYDNFDKIKSKVLGKAYILYFIQNSLKMNQFLSKDIRFFLEQRKYVFSMFPSHFVRSYKMVSPNKCTQQRISWANEQIEAKQFLLRIEINDTTQLICVR